MIAKIVDNRWIYLLQMPVEVEKSILDHFSVRDPRAHYIDSDYWDGWYRRYDTKNRRLALPFLTELKNYMVKIDVPLEVFDERPPIEKVPEDRITKDMLAGITLEDYQIGAIKSTLNNEIGCIQAPTGAGKCITGESNIILNGIEIPISNLFTDFLDEEIKDVSNFELYVLGINGYNKINKLYKTSPRPIKKLILDNGGIIRGVDEHRIFTKNGWKQLCQITESDEIIKREGDGISNKWGIYSQIQSSSYRVRLCVMRDTVCEKSIFNIKDDEEIWKTSLYKMYEIIGTKNGITEQSKFIQEDVSLFRNRTYKKQLYEKSRNNKESHGDMQKEVWNISASEFAQCGQIRVSEERCTNKNENREVTEFARGYIKIQGNNEIKINRRDREYKEEEKRDVAQESFDEGIYKRIVFAFSENTDQFYNYKIWENTISEQIRVEVHRVLCKIEEYLISREGSNNKIRQFMVFIRFYDSDNNKQIDNRNKIEILIRIEEEQYIIEENSRREICTKSFNEICPNNLRQMFKNGFYYRINNWNKVKHVVDDGIENCYDLQVEDISHSFWTNNILSHNTEIICGIVKLYDCSCVIITEQTVVLNQIVNRLQIRKVAEKVDKFCHGFLPTGKKIMVGSLQSLFVAAKPKKAKVTLTRHQVFSRLLKMVEREDENLTKVLPSALIEVMTRNPENIMKLKGTYYELAHNYFRDQEYDKRLKWHSTRHGNADIIREAVSTCDMICVDEADLASTTQYSKLFRTVFNGRRRYGFSGTFNDPGRPIQNLFIKENLGSIIHEVPRQEVQGRGRIIPVRPVFIVVGRDGDKEDRRAYDIAMREEIIENEVLHSKIKTIVDSFPKDKTLILLDTSPIGELGEALRDKISGSRFLWNKSSKSERDECLKLFESGELMCLIGGKIFQRGLDILGGVDNLIVVGGGKQRSNINQMVGRAVRRNARGWARVFLFFFLNNKYLYHHSRENIKAVIDMGYNPKICVGNVVLDGVKFVKSRFRIKI